MNATAPAPGHDCSLCPRLVAFRHQVRTVEPDWFNAPVPTFGRDDASLLVVGLAPGLRGANRTGRPFTGDFAGELLYATLLRCGFAVGTYDSKPDDGLELQNCAITNAVRCVPPQNKPQPAEIATCRPFLGGQLNRMLSLKAVVALGRIAHESVVRALGGKISAIRFVHGRRHDIVRTGHPTLTLFDSYHCSRYNTSTRLLTEAMFRAVFEDAKAWLDATQSATDVRRS